MTLGKISLSIMTISKRILVIMSVIIMTIRLMTIGIMKLSIMAVSIMTQHNNTTLSKI